MDVVNFRNRINSVRLGAFLARTNHILQATARAMTSHICKNGFKVTGNLEDALIQTHYVPFVRDAITSLLAVGYFAVVINAGSPAILAPDIYVVVAAEDADIPNPKPFNVIFLNQIDCDKYRHRQPNVYVQFAPTRTGQLTCPSMHIVDMHDATTEFIRLALLNDAINLRPKAWASERDSKMQSGVFTYLQEDEKYITPEEKRKFELTQKNRQEASNYVAERNKSLFQPAEEPRMFASACVSRAIDPGDPGTLVNVLPNLDITAMASTHTRTDLVELIRLFDQRMCNALGVPPYLIGLPVPMNAANNYLESLRLWECTITPFRAMLNIALADVVEETVTKPGAIQFKKTRDRKWLQPSRIEIEPSVSIELLQVLQPFLTPLAFARHMAKGTGLQPSDFQQEPIYAKPEKAPV